MLGSFWFFFLLRKEKEHLQAWRTLNTFPNEGLIGYLPIEDCHAIARNDAPGDG
jgi:hypothetical protein